MKTFQKNEKGLPYKITLKNNKNAYFRIKNDGLHVTAPARANPMVLKVIENRFDEFYQAYENMLKQKPTKQTIQLAGKVYHYELIEDKRFKYHLLEDKIFIYGKQHLMDIHIKKIYLNHLKQMVLSIEDDIHQNLKKHGIKPRPMRYKFLRSKFGSYHKTNDEITLNTFLATLDIQYLIYVIYHEYAHTVHFNHSKAFYDFLEKLMPNYVAYHKGLKKIAII